MLSRMVSHKDSLKFGLVACSFVSLIAVLYPSSHPTGYDGVKEQELQQGLLNASLEKTIPLPDTSAVPIPMLSLLKGGLHPLHRPSRHGAAHKVPDTSVEMKSVVIKDTLAKLQAPVEVKKKVETVVAAQEDYSIPHANWGDISYSLHRPSRVHLAPVIPASVHENGGKSVSKTSVAYRNSPDETSAAARFSRIVPIFKPSAPGAMKSINCFVQAIAGEARGETDTGQVGVAAVIKNRVNMWGGTYCGNIYSKSGSGCQFYGACRGVRHYSQDVVDRAKTIAAAIISGTIHDVTGGALYFHTCSVGSNEYGHRFLRKIKNHCYYADDMSKKKVDNISYRLIKDDTKEYGYRMEEYRI